MSEKITDLIVKKYTEKSIVIRGNTKLYKEELKTLGGKYNSRLRDGPGWIFPKTMEEEVNNFINGSCQDIIKKDYDFKYLPRHIEKKMDRMSCKVDKIYNMLEKILSLLEENEHNVEEESEEEIPKKRLLR